MATTSVVLTIQTEKTIDQVRDDLQLSANKVREEAGALEYFIKEATTGITTRGSIRVQTADAAPVRASGTATLASVAADDTITIGGTVLTAKASPATESQFSQTGTDTQDAASLAAVINAHSVLSKLVVASSLAAVVTITSLVPGVIGNQITLAKSASTITLLPTTRLGSGAGAAEDAGSLFSFGI